MGIKIKARVSKRVSNIKKLRRHIQRSKIRALEVGWFNTPIATIAFFNDQGTEHAPPRPMLSDLDGYVTKNDLAEFAKSIATMRAQGNPRASAAKVERQLRNRVLSNNYAKNASATVKQKGFNRPLFETGDMADAVKGRVK